MRYHLISIRITTIKKKQEIISVGEDVEKLEPLCSIGGNVKWCSVMENSMKFPQKLKMELPYDLAVLFLGIYPKELKAGSQRDFYTHMFIAALFTIAKRQKQPKCPSVYEQIKEMWYIHTTNYYSALKKEILSRATTWMNLESIILSKIIQ